MGLTAADFLQPAGELAPSLFSEIDGATLNGWLAAWITAGESAASGLSGAALDGAVAAYVYARAWGVIYQHLATTPAQAAGEEGGSYTYLAAQITLAGAERDRWQAKYETALAEASLGAPPPPVRPPATQRVTFSLF